MILESIIINSMRSYAHQEIVFPTGVSLFEGDIGSGKSTVLMAVEFALFGLGSQKAESLLARKADKGYVTLEFSVDGNKYEVHRELHRKKSGVSQDSKNSWVKADGQKEPLSASEQKQRILQILKFNEPTNPKAESRIFRYAVFTPQEEMKAVLSEPEKRLETIRKAFNIEEYSTAASNAAMLLRGIESKKDILEERFSGIQELRDQNAQSKNTVAELESSVREADSRAGRLRHDEGAVLEELKGLREKMDEKAKADAQIKVSRNGIQASKRHVELIERNMEELNKELLQNEAKIREAGAVKRPDTTKTIQEINNEIAVFQNMREKLAANKARREGIRAEVAGILTKLGEMAGMDKESLEAERRGADDKAESLKKKLESLEQRLEALKEARTQKQTRMDDIKEEVRRLESLGSKCPTCGQVIDAQGRQSIVDEKKSHAELLKIEIDDAIISMDKTRSEIEEMTLELKAAKSASDKMQDAIVHTSNLEKARTDLEKVEAVIAEAKGGDGEGEEHSRRLEEIKDGLVEYEAAKLRSEEAELASISIKKRIVEHAESKNEEIAQISRHEADLRRLTESYEFDGLDGQIAKKESEAAKLREDITVITAQIERQKEAKRQEEYRIVQNNEKIAESEESKKKHADISECGDWTRQFFIPTVKEIEKLVLRAVWQEFNETYRRWYSILVEDPTKESSIDENFTPTVHQDAYEQRVEYLSGGERTSIALAYRLTLNSLIRKMTNSMQSNLLILDEPTDGFSKNQLEKMHAVLDELESKQIILVSHDRELETYANHVFKITKQNGASTVTPMHNKSP